MVRPVFAEQFLLGQHLDALFAELTGSISRRRAARWCKVCSQEGRRPVEGGIRFVEQGGKGLEDVRDALAWSLAVAPNVVLIPGTSSRRHLRENLEASHVQLDADTLDRLSSGPPRAR